jgi:hypothetical protein
MIFKKGDKVYDHAYGWGEVCEHSIGELSLCVDFEDVEIGYHSKGCLEIGFKPTLSFTEYTLDGFSQERPKEPLPFKVGDVVYVYGNGEPSFWATSNLSLVDFGHDYPFEVHNGLLGDSYERLALENPLLNPDTKIYTKEDL